MGPWSQLYRQSWLYSFKKLLSLYIPALKNDKDKTCISETQLQASKIQIKQFGGKGLKLYQLWIIFIKGTDKV